VYGRFIGGSFFEIRLNPVLPGSWPLSFILFSGFDLSVFCPPFPFFL